MGEVQLWPVLTGATQKLQWTPMRPKPSLQLHTGGMAVGEGDSEEFSVVKRASRMPAAEQNARVSNAPLPPGARNLAHGGAIRDAGRAGSGIASPGPGRLWSQVFGGRSSCLQHGLGVGELAAPKGDRGGQKKEEPPWPASGARPLPGAGAVDSSSPGIVDRGAVVGVSCSQGAGWRSG